MATLKELFSSRQETIEQDRPTATREYVVEEAASEAEVKAAATAGIPPLHGELVLKSWAIEERLTEDTWKVSARYEKADPAPVDPLFGTSSTFDITNAPVHIERSIQTLAMVGPKAIDLGGLIDYDGKTVHGVDIILPVFTFTMTRKVHRDLVDVNFKKDLARRVGTVNGVAFQGYSAGEVLMTCVSGREKSDKVEVEITSSFAVRFNYDAATINGLAIPARPGWSHLWFRYEDQVVSGQVKKVAVAAYVEQIYPEYPGGGVIYL